MGYVSIISFGSPEFDEAVRLRYLVLREPLGLDFTAEHIAAEFDKVHIAHFNHRGHINGYLQLVAYPDGETVQMKQVAVAADAQRQGIGAKLVGVAEDWAKNKALKTMLLHARASAIPFYQNLDYQAVGEKFEEVGIEHLKFIKRF